MGQSTIYVTPTVTETLTTTITVISTRPPFTVWTLETAYTGSSFDWTILGGVKRHISTAKINPTAVMAADVNVNKMKTDENEKFRVVVDYQDRTFGIEGEGKEFSFTASSIGFPWQ